MRGSRPLTFEESRFFEPVAVEPSTGYSFAIYSSNSHISGSGTLLFKGYAEAISDIRDLTEYMTEEVDVIFRPRGTIEWSILL